ncbi:MAG: glycosyltransferase [Acidobacteria bacterium]|nr:glycosyltransferase [Acidobacteriota bacterium]
MGKNILQFIPSFHQGGSERQAVQLTKLLLENGEHRIFTAALNKEGVLLEELKQAGVSDIWESKLKSFFDIRFFREAMRCRSLLKKNKIEIVQTHDFYTNIFGILSAKLAGVAVKIASKRETEGVRTEMQKRVERYVFKFADAIIVNSRSVKTYLTENGVEAGKLNVVYNGVDTERLAPKETDRNTICEMLHLPSDPGIKFITQVANLRHDVKNQEMLLRAAQRIKDDFPGAHFVFAGEGDRRKLLEKTAKDLGVLDKVHFIGRCNSVPELLSISAVCCLTSTAEGFSNAILEYMNAGKPVVATDVGGAAEAIVEGRTGFLVGSNDDAGLADRIGEFLRDDRMASEFGKNGRERICKDFSTSKQTAETLNLYERL